MNQIKFCKPWGDASGSVDYFNCGYTGSVVTTFPVWPLDLQNKGIILKNSW